MPPSYRWVILGACTLGFMQTHIHRVGLAPLIPTFVADLRLSYAAAGSIMTAYFWTYALVQALRRPSWRRRSCRRSPWLPRVSRKRRAGGAAALDVPARLG